jgi:hypothetical protein
MPVARTYGDLGRVPVFLWENGANGSAVAVERRVNGTYSIWRAGDFDSAGRSPHPWCASAASDLFTGVGSAFTVSGATAVGVDDMDAGNVPATSDDTYALSWCPEALAAYKRADAGLGFVAMGNTTGNTLDFQRTCSGCAAENLGTTAFAGELGEGVTDGAQAVWFSLWNMPQGSVELRKLPRDALNWTVKSLSVQTPAVRVQLASSGSLVHAGWVLGATLTIVDATLDAGVPENITLPEPGRLVDLVEGPRSLVAVLEFGDRTVLFIRDTSGAEGFFLISTPLLFHPTVAHLKRTLRISGTCDGGTGCVDNPILEFLTLPDGGAW